MIGHWNLKSHYIAKSQSFIASEDMRFNFPFAKQEGVAFEKTSQVRQEVTIPVEPKAGKEVSELEVQAVLRAEQLGQSGKVSELVSELKSDRPDDEQKSVTITKHKKSFTKVVGKHTPLVEEVKQRIWQLKYTYIEYTTAELSMVINCSENIDTLRRRNTAFDTYNTPT